jgi:hypothetical protein
MQGCRQGWKIHADRRAFAGRGQQPRQGGSPKGGLIKHHTKCCAATAGAQTTRLKSVNVMSSRPGLTPKKRSPRYTRAQPHAPVLCTCGLHSIPSRVNFSRAAALRVPPHIHASGSESVARLCASARTPNSTRASHTCAAAAAGSGRRVSLHGVVCRMHVQRPTSKLLPYS